MVEQRPRSPTGPAGGNGGNGSSMQAKGGNDSLQAEGGDSCGARVEGGGFGPSVPPAVSIIIGATGRLHSFLSQIDHTVTNYCSALTEIQLDHLNLTNAIFTWTTLSHCVKGFWKSPRVTLIRIEVLVVLTAIGLLFLATFGSRRRKSRNFFIQKGVLGVYTLSASLVSYTLGSMQSSAVKSSMYPIWAMSIYILAGCADSITAYSVDDNNQTARLYFQGILNLLYAVLVAASVSSPLGSLPMLYLALIVYLKSVYRLWASRVASNSWYLNKIVADYMYGEHTGRGSSYEAASMTGYHYLVDWPLCNSELKAGASYATQVIDIERIWMCNGLSPELKDTCLSFSLFHLLRRRFFGFECGEYSLPKTHDFVFKGLLSSKNEDGPVDYNRAFKVIDVELAFMYDFFFTRNAVNYYGSRGAPFWRLLSVGLIILTACLTARRVMRFSSKGDVSVVLDPTMADVIITVSTLSCIALLEVLQQLYYWTTIWGRVSFVCQRVREEDEPKTSGSCRMRFREILPVVGVSAPNKYYYQDELGQYSLLDSVMSYNRSPSKVGPKIWRCLQLFHNVFCLPDFWPLCHNIDFDALRVRKGLGKPIKVPAEVKEALVQSLERTQGILTNGESSLEFNQEHNLLWACRHNKRPDSSTSSTLQKGNQVHFILTWHVATCYCEMETLKYLSPRVAGKLKFHLDVATILSKYCAYLVVSAPKLLPGHHYDTELVFDAVAVEAIEYLRCANLPESSEVRNLPESADAKDSTEPAEASIFQKGMKLGKQLEQIELGKRWKVLADFWAEMMLYLAPSDNVKEHIECLANGGEFITHLWALLTHAGILDRGQRNVVDIENNAGADQPYPGELSYGAAFWLGRARSYLDKCRQGAALATRPATQSGYYVQPGMVQQQVNLAQNVEGTPNACTAPSEIEEIK